jgi:hypothetical protein
VAELGLAPSHESEVAVRKSKSRRYDTGISPYHNNRIEQKQEREERETEMSNNNNNDREGLLGGSQVVGDTYHT